MASVTRTAVKPLQGGVGFVLTASDEWPPQAVAVAWDGTAAAGDFVVAVSYYSDGGVLIDRAWPEGVTNTTGDTGRTFFRPFKRGGAASAAGGGIQFDTFPQGGGYLYATTSDSPSSPNGWDIELASTAGTWLHSAGNSVVESDTGLTVRSSNGNIGVQAPGTGKSVGISAQSRVTLDTDNAFAYLDGAITGVAIYFGAYDKEVRMQLGAASKFRISDSSGNSILEVRDDGTYHIKAGGVWATDL